MLNENDSACYLNSVLLSLHNGMRCPCLLWILTVWTPGVKRLGCKTKGRGALDVNGSAGLVCLPGQVWTVGSYVNTFTTCFASEGPFLFKDKIAFLKQKCWVSRRMALSFRRSLPEIGARSLLMVLRGGKEDAQTMLCFAFQSLQILAPCLCIFKIPFNI